MCARSPKYATKLKQANGDTAYGSDALYGLLRARMPKLLAIDSSERLPRDSPTPVGVAYTDVGVGVDVLIPCYKHACFVNYAVASCLSQSHKPNSIVVLLMDEESIARKAELEALDASVHCVVSERMFPSEARNTLFQHSTASHVLFLDADDTLEDLDVLAELMRFYMYDIVMPEWKAGEDIVSRATLYNVIFYSQTTALIRRAFFETNQFDVKLKNGAEDTEFFLRSYLRGASIRYSRASFKKSEVTAASYWSVERYGSYDVLYKHRNVFLPILREVYEQELNAIELSRIFYLIKLLEQDLQESNIFELSEKVSVPAIYLARSTHVKSTIRARFNRMITCLRELAMVNKDNNELYSERYIKQPGLVAHKPVAVASVSVIIPCYMQSVFVADAVRSILNQTRQDCVKEILVLLMDRWSQALKLSLEALDPRVRCYLHKRVWLPEARNYLSIRASGDYLIPLDADDKLAADYIEKVSEFAPSHDIVLVDIVRPDGLTSTSCFENTTVKNLFDFPVTHPTAFISREFILSKLDGRPYDPLFNTGFEDHDFWFQAALVGKLKYVREPFIVYRDGGPREATDVSYLSLASANFNDLEMLLKYKRIYRDYTLVCSLSKDPAVQKAAAKLLDVLNSIEGLKLESYAT